MVLPFAAGFGALAGGSDITPSSAQSGITGQGANEITTTVVQNFGGSDKSIDNFLNRTLDRFSDITKNAVKSSGVLGGLGLQQKDVSLIVMGGIILLALFVANKAIK